MIKKAIFGGLYLVILASAAVLIAEAVIRISLFTDYLPIQKLKDPGLYGGYTDDDDYWKMYYRFNGEFKPPKPQTIHPVLGWSQIRVDPKNPLGLTEETRRLMRSDKMKDKVLFYGDSFVKGVSSPINEIPRVMNRSFGNTAVVDLGCAGYGLDQMFLLFGLTHHQVGRSHIVFGVFLGDDLDRSVLSVRTGQKPYFVIRGNQLKLQGLPIDPDPGHYFKTHPPRIRSYLCRILIREWVRRTGWHRARQERIAEKMDLTSRIIDSIHAVCRKRDYPLCFVLFHYDPQITTWQEAFLRRKLRDLGVPVMDTRESLMTYAKNYHILPDNFYVLEGPGRGHHNDLGNQVIGKALSEYLTEVYGLR